MFIVHFNDSHAKCQEGVSLGVRLVRPLLRIKGCLVSSGAQRKSATETRGDISILVGMQIILCLLPCTNRLQKQWISGNCHFPRSLMQGEGKRCSLVPERNLSLGVMENGGRAGNQKENYTLKSTDTQILCSSLQI